MPVERRLAPAEPTKLTMERELLAPERDQPEHASASRPAAAGRWRLDLAAIGASLRGVQRHFDRINRRLDSPRDRMSDDVVRNMVAGYALVDQLVNGAIDVFAMGSHSHLLELNTVVLCGTDPVRRAEYAEHRTAADRRFYDQRDGGIRDLVEWYGRHRRESVWRRAAGAYVRVLSQPQLFIEGNHRTGALIMSYLLGREGEPPFVLSIENAPAFFAPSTIIRETAKQSLAMLFRMPRFRKRLAAFLEDHADPRYVHTTA